MLPEELMKMVRQLETRTRRSVSEVFAGEYSSAFRGRGMEFSEVREYQPGDDVRAIDWNVTARMGAPYIKRYVEERELTVMLVVDVSGSERFGSTGRIKSEAAAELCGVLAMAATKNNDRVGLLIFDRAVELYIPPKKGLRHVLRIIRELLEAGQDKGARSAAPKPTPPERRAAKDEPGMGGALRQLAQALKRRSVVCVVSDYLPEFGAAAAIPRSTRSGVLAAEIEAALRHLARRHDLIAARIVDERERRLPRAGLIELEDAETGRRVVVDSSSAAVRRAFEAAMHRREESLDEQLRRVGADRLTVQPHEPYVHALVELFRRREKRR